MLKIWASTMLFQGSWEEIWRENRHGGCWFTLIALSLILVWHCSKTFSFRFSSPSNPTTATTTTTTTAISGSTKIHSQFRISEIVPDADLKLLIEKLDQKLNESEKWEQVIDKRNSLLSYNAKCCKPKDGPLKYLSVTVFENCSPEMLKNFYMDNDYRKQWDKTVIEHEQLHVDKINGVEIGRTIKKFPLLTPREYVLAWRLWEGKDKTFYCYLKECEHPSVPRLKKFVRVRFFRSGWQIRKVPGRNACEIKMFHQEDAGLNVEMAKLAFAKGIWSYVCKMDSALRKYSGISHPQLSSAVTLIQKVPPGLDTMNSTTSSETTSAAAFRGQTGEAKERKISKRPSRKLLANGLLLLGGAICLSRGHSSLGAKIAMAYILTKLSKHGASSDQSSQS